MALQMQASGVRRAEAVVSVAPEHTEKLSERLANPDAVLSRTDLRALGFERRAVDCIFRQLDTIVIAGYSRPLIRVSDYKALIAKSTYDGKTRVRPT
jgi:hypothetical protein